MPPVPTVEYDGSAIRDHRLYLGYTQADLAKLTDRKTRTINDIERNRHPKVSKLIIGQLARVLQTKPEEFIRISEEDAA